jgi:hypothetical protein
VRLSLHQHHVLHVHAMDSVAAFRSIQSGASRWVVSWITIFSPWSVLTSHGQETHLVSSSRAGPAIAEIQSAARSLACQGESSGAALSVEIRYRCKPAHKDRTGLGCMPTCPHGGQVEG